MGPETKAAHTIRRSAIQNTAGRTLFRSERIRESEENGLARFEEKVDKEGYGGIVVLKHFSLKDPPQALKDIVFGSSVLRGKEVVVPAARHQVYPGLRQFARLFGVTIDPIVTERTVERAIEKEKPIPKIDEGRDQFVKDALDHLKRGQLVALAPEGTRRPNLEPYPKSSIGSLLGAARLAKAKVAVLFVDFRVAGQEEGYWDRSGFNPLKKYEARIGRCLTAEEMLQMANGSFKQIDEGVVLPEMRRAAAIVKPSKS